MSFTAIQEKYSQARKEYRESRKAAYLARQQSLLVEKRITEFLRTALLTTLPAAHALQAERAGVQKKLAAAEARLAASRQASESARAALDSLGRTTQTISNLNDATPILLFPLRLQTRYSIIRHIARNCPDDCLVDVERMNPAIKRNILALFPDLKPPADPASTISSQAKTLSNQASGLALRVIQEINRSTGFLPTQKRWRKVEDEFELWVRIFPDDIFLCSHEPALTEPEMAAARIFWQAMWDAEREFRKVGQPGAADDDTKNQKQLEAWKQLRLDCLPHRASWIARVMRPADYPEKFPLSLTKIPVEKFPDPGLKSESWTIPPYTDLLPEHFVVRIVFKNPSLPSREVTGAPIPDYLQMGFDPDEQDETAFSEKERTLELPRAIRWLTDLPEAEKLGMAVRVSLSRAEHAAGIEKILVAGVKTGLGSQEGGEALTALFDNHHYKPDGMAFLPQGTATNNLPDQPSGFSQAGLSDEASFRVEFPGKEPGRPDADGRFMEKALGLPGGFFNTIIHQDGTEGREALLINRALWPATLGYYLDNHLRPNTTDADIAFAKSFFEQHVSGRGLLPCFRVGKQPYGIVASTAWSSWQPDASSGSEAQRLVKLLKKLDEQWGKLSVQVKTVKRIFQNTNEQQLKKEFRELLASQASSTRFLRRLVAGEYLLWNVNKMTIPLNTEKAGIKTDPDAYKKIMEAPAAWGQALNMRPRILGRFHDDTNYILTDLPPGATGQDNLDEAGRNYLSILTAASLEQLKTNSYGDAFGKMVTQRSSRLLFYLARFALLQGWVNAAVELLRNEKKIISPLARLDFEMEYIIGGTAPSHEHRILLGASGIGGNFETRKNKWAFFEEKLLDGTPVSEKIGQRLNEKLSPGDPVLNLQNTLVALRELSSLPVESLERLLSEHVDLCSFRLDAWLQGLAISRLFANREKPGFEKGIFIGSYGYLEDLKPGPAPWVQVKEISSPQVIPANQAGIQDIVMPVYDFSGLNRDQINTTKKRMFVYLGSDPAALLVEDQLNKKIIQAPNSLGPAKGGFVLTPSLEHAATAGILRAGYEHHSLAQGPESRTLAVNLSPARTGRAMEMLKAMRAGHSLNEQLGYFIERKMYEDASLAQFIPALRKAFPLHIERNEWDNDQQIAEKDKVTNLALVTDGLAIIQKMQNPAPPPSWNDKLVSIFGSLAPPKTGFTGIVEAAIEQFDAVSDLVLAETVFQTVKGSPERAAAALRMLGEGSDIILPEVAEIPIESRVLSFRAGFVLNAVGNLVNAWPLVGIPSIFVRMNPQLNRWLAEQLPSPKRIVARIITTDQSPLRVRILSTNLQPVDFYYLLLKTGYRPEESLLTWFFEEAARNTPGVDRKKIAGVSFERDSGFAPHEISIREIIPMIQTIGSMLKQSRPMKPGDLLLNTNTQSVSGLYNNTALVSLLQEYTEKAAQGPIPVFLQKLEQAHLRLQEHFPKGFGSPESEAAFQALYRLLPEGYFLGIWDTLPRCPPEADDTNANILLGQAAQLMEQLKKRLLVVHELFSRIQQAGSSLDGAAQFEELSKLGKQICGEDFLVLPVFSLSEKEGIKACLNDAAFATSIGEFGLEEWLQGLAVVRANLGRYQLMGNLRSAFESIAANRAFRILQLPWLPGGVNHWIGAPFPKGYEPPPQATSLVYEYSAAFNVNLPLSGFIVDDWREKLPLPEHTAGVAINYDQSNAEAPQCLLLVVPPEQKGSWEWPVLMNAVEESMNLARKRAVDGEILQTTWLSQFLPAIVTPVDAKNNTPNLDFRWAGPPVKPVFGGIGGVLGGITGGVIGRF